MSKDYSRILVTGGAGFIGSHIVDKLLAEGFEVSVLDNLSTGKIENVKGYFGRKDFKFLKGDLRDFDLLKQVTKEVDVIFHEAALSSVPRSVKNPVLSHETNATGTLNLLRASCDNGVDRLIHASSSSVYGQSDLVERDENLPTQPISPYAVSKLAAENYCGVFYEVYGFKTVSLRYFNVYGIRQNYGPYSGVITRFVNRVLKQKPPIIYGDGKQLRDFINVKDVVRANLLSMKSQNAVGEALNIGTGKATSITSLANMILQITGNTQLKPIYQKPRPGDVKNSCANITKAKRSLGYSPTITLKQGLSILIANMRAQSKK